MAREDLFLCLHLFVCLGLLCLVLALRWPLTSLFRFQFDDALFYREVWGEQEVLASTCFQDCFAELVSLMVLG